MATRTVSVDLRAKVDNYVSGMKKAAAASRSAQDAAEKNRRESALMGKVAAVVGTAVAVQFAKKIVNAASDLNETVSKSSVVFGKNAAAVQAWAKTSAKAFGMSENAALGAASTYGNLFVSLGLAEEQSAKMSTKLVELAGDLASFNNVSPEEALDALRSGLVGETEPLKRFGVNMNEATLKAQAMKMGLVDTTKTALDPATKAQAAYALILEQTTTAQGDFARTSDGLANQQRILNAEWENAQASLGQTLLPAMTEAVSVLNNMLSAFNALPAPVKTVTLGVVALGAATVLLLPRIAATRAALAELGITAKLSGAGMASFGKFAGIATIALAAMTVAVGKINESAAESVPEVDALTTALLDLGKNGKNVLTSASDETYSFADALNRITDPSVTDRLNDFWGWVGSGGDAGPELVAMRKYIEGIDAALAGLVANGKAEEAAAAFDLLAKDAQAQGRSIDDVKAMLPGYTAALGAAAGGNGDLAAATQDASAAAAAAKKEVRELSDVLEALRGHAQTVAEANAGLEQSFDDAAKAAKDMKGGVNEARTALDLNTQAGRDGQDALLNIVDAAYDTATAMTEAGQSTDKVRARTMDARVEFIQIAKRMGLTESAAKKLADKYGLIPDKISTTIKANNSQAIAAVDAVLARWQDVLDMPTAVLNAHFGVTGSGSTKKAGGGFVSGPGSATSDSIPARLSNGEYVVKAASVRKYGTAMLGDINSGRYAKGGKVARKGPRPQWDSGFRDQMRSGASVLSFDFGAYGQAVERARSALRGYRDAVSAVADARRRVNEAGSPEEQAQAMRDLAEAERDAASAKREVAAADKAKAAAKPTGKNVLAAFKDRANKLTNFRKNLAILAKRGLSRVIIQQLLEAGIDEGGEMAAAIVRDGNIAQLNATQASINKSSAQLAFAYGPNPTADTASGSSSSTGTTGSSSSSVVLSFEHASRPIVVKMDSTQVWKGLLALKRSNGGASLGLG